MLLEIFFTIEHIRSLMVNGDSDLASFSQSFATDAQNLRVSVVIVFIRLALLPL